MNTSNVSCGSSLDSLEKVSPHHQFSHQYQKRWVCSYNQPTFNHSNAYTKYQFSSDSVDFRYGSLLFSFPCLILFLFFIIFFFLFFFFLFLLIWFISPHSFCCFLSSFSCLSFLDLFTTLIFLTFLFEFLCFSFLCLPCFSFLYLLNILIHFIFLFLLFFVFFFSLVLLFFLYQITISIYFILLFLSLFFHAFHPLVICTIWLLFWYILHSFFCCFNFSIPVYYSGLLDTFIFFSCFDMLFSTYSLFLFISPFFLFSLSCLSFRYVFTILSFFLFSVAFVLHFLIYFSFSLSFSFLCIFLSFFIVLTVLFPSYSSIFPKHLCYLVPITFTVAYIHGAILISKFKDAFCCFFHLSTYCTLVLSFFICKMRF